MGLNYKLINRTTNTKLSDVVHTTSYARAERENRPGVVGMDTFQKRMEIDQSRQHIQGYHHSKLMNDTTMKFRSQKQSNYATEALRAEMAEASGAAADGREAIRERGGLKRFDAQKDEGFYARRSSSRRFGTDTNTAQTGTQPYSRQNAATQRQTMANRFSGTARPVPRSGGFGRH